MNGEGVGDAGVARAPERVERVERLEEAAHAAKASAIAVELVARVAAAPALQRELRLRCRWEPQGRVVSRFLQASGGDAGAALDAIIADLRWRASAGVDLEAAVALTPREVLQCSPAAAANKFAWQARGRDRAGRPVLYYCGRAVDATALLRLSTPARLVRYAACAREAAIRRRLREEPSATPPYFTVVVDLRGSRLAQANRDFYGLARALAELEQRHFPGAVAHVVVVNAPIFFSVVWSVLRKFLTQETAREVSVAGPGRKEALRALRAFIDVAQLPVNFGGDAPALAGGTAAGVVGGEAKSAAGVDGAVGCLPVRSFMGTPEPAGLPNEEAKDKEDGEGSEHEHVHVRAGGEPELPDSKIEMASEMGAESPGTVLPAHIATLVYDESNPSRPGLRGELLRAVDDVLAERDAFEQLALRERRHLRARLRSLQRRLQRRKSLSLSLSPSGASRCRQASDASSSSTDLENLPNAPSGNAALVEAGLRARILGLRQQLLAAKEECHKHARAVKFARNYMEQETALRAEECARLEQAVLQLRGENKRLLRR